MVARKQQKCGSGNKSLGYLTAQSIAEYSKPKKSLVSTFLLFLLFKLRVGRQIRKKVED
jgi:hypothetical protein